MGTAADDFKTNIESQIKAITDRYKPAIDDLQARGQKLADDYEKPSVGGAVLGIDFDVDWKEEKIVFDLPTVTMRTTEISMDIPETRMERQDISFHAPSVRMVPKKVGQYPEFHGFTVVWKDIIIDVPEVSMEEQKISFDLPSVTMKRQEWKLDLPEFGMERQEWFVKLPQFELKNVTLETEKVKDAGQKLQDEGKQLGERMKAEINAVIAGSQAMNSQNGNGVKTEIASQFDSSISALMKAIDELTVKGIDPIKVPTKNGDVNLRKQLAELIAQRDKAAQETDATLTAAPPEPAAQVVPVIPPEKPVSAPEATATATKPEVAPAA